MPDTLLPDGPDRDASGARTDRVIASLGALLPAVLRRDGDSLTVKDATGDYLHADAAWLECWACTANDIIGRGDGVLFEPAVVAALRIAEQAALAQTGALISEHKVERLGVRRDFSVLRQRLDGGDGRTLLAAVWRDLAPLRRSEALRAAAIEQLEAQQRANEALRREMQDHTLRDSETGLYNRAHFEDQLRREVDLSTREHREFALVSIELDPPPADVVALGSAARVRVYEALGRLLRGNTRAMDASCRFDETRFAVLLSGVGLATAHSRMEGLRRQCATQIVAHDGRDIGFTASMGVASFPHTAHTQEELSAACDLALADARQRGGNHVTLASIRFDPS
ncbi:MAG: diguanylate cyclase [Pseudomonadota bacterium]